MTPSPFAFSRYPNASVFSDADRFRIWFDKHRPTKDVVLGDAKEDTLIHALVRHGGFRWLTPTLWASLGFSSEDFQYMARKNNAQGDTAFHVAMGLEKEIDRTQSVSFCLKWDPSLVATEHVVLGYTKQITSTLIRFLDVWADRATALQERSGLQQILHSICKHGGHTSCSIHPIQFVTAQDTLEGILPELTHPLFEHPPQDISLVREPRHSTMRGMTDPWRGDATSSLNLKDWLTSNIDVAKKLRGWLFQQPSLERLQWWSTVSHVPLSTHTIAKGKKTLPLSEHVARLCNTRSQGLPRQSTLLAAELFLKEHQGQSSSAFGEAFHRAIFSAKPYLSLSDFPNPLPYRLDDLIFVAQDLFDDTGSPPLSHVILRTLFSPSARVDEKVTAIRFLSVNSEGVSWKRLFCAQLNEEELTASGLTSSSATNTSLIDLFRLGVSQVLQEIDRPKTSPYISVDHVKSSIQHSVSLLERSLLLERASASLSSKASSAFAL